ncbi:predicted protein [Lichtheimia corymbifera JMRC:FSU:9682]|uniref:Uncharacterized protein n=1 Tax=Lichtheimia corymbifera JMRC:FSU:9682 TaxID=1263082 RepID=A0A068RMF2_9FUNG|nr:predicted protein [Lichtheimia corymbifera JMRC:FSU:9682]
MKHITREHHHKKTSSQENIITRKHHHKAHDKRTSSQRTSQANIITKNIITKNIITKNTITKNIITKNITSEHHKSIWQRQRFMIFLRLSNFYDHTNKALSMERTTISLSCTADKFGEACVRPQVSKGENKSGEGAGLHVRPWGEETSLAMELDINP